jgi:excisionase family DNA binding protein
MVEMIEDPRYLTCAEVAALFGIPAEHIRRRAIRREIPHTRFGRRHIRFSLQDVAEIERMHRVLPLPLPTEKPSRSQGRRTQSRVIEIGKPQRKRSNNVS